MDRKRRDSHRPDSLRSYQRATSLVLIPLLLLVGGLLLAIGAGRQQPAPPQAPGPAAATASAAGPPSPPAVTPEPLNRPVPALPASIPERVTLPSLGVSSALESLTLDGKQRMETPSDPAKAGWYQPGPAPGSLGPAVIAGHVTWNGEPAVFFRLAELRPKDRVAVLRRDGRTAEFTVDRVAVYAKDQFPTVEVYRNLDYAGLRLITCGGTYSAADHRYADNVVVYATLTSSRR